MQALTIWRWLPLSRRLNERRTSADSILIADANPESYSRIEDDIIVPIDLITHPIEVSILRSTAQQTGIDLDLLMQSKIDSLIG